MKSSFGYENNVSTFSFSFQGASSLSGDDIKLSERLYIPGRKLRGFESGKIGPKDGSDFIGGNYVSTINATTTIPKILENVPNANQKYHRQIAKTKLQNLIPLLIRADNKERLRRRTSK